MDNFQYRSMRAVESAIKVNKMTGSSVPDGLLVSQPKDIEYAMKSFSSSLIISVDNQDQHVDSVLYIDDLCAQVIPDQ